MAKASKSTGLGRGFESLIPEGFDSSLLVDEQNRTQKLLISDIKPAKQQPRTEFDDKLLNDLANSIKRHGVLQPIIVRPEAEGYSIVAGERRWRAAQKAGLTHISAVVRTLEELEQLELALVENVQREDLSPLDQAMSINRLVHQFNLSVDAIAQRLGKASSTVSNLGRLVQLPDSAQQALQAGKISEGHARTIVSIGKWPDKQEELLQLILKNKWTVRQAEQFALATRKGKQTEAATAKLAITTPATQKLSKNLGTPVSIKRTAKGGKLEIAFKNDAQLTSLIKQLNEKS